MDPGSHKALRIHGFFRTRTGRPGLASLPWVRAVVSGVITGVVTVSMMMTSGCASSKEGVKEADAPPKTAPKAGKEASKYAPATLESLSPIRGVDLRLTKFQLAGKAVAMPSATPTTLKLGDGGRIAGKAPVNRYFGAMQLAVDGSGRLTWPNAALGMTRLAGPPEAMALESTFVRGLTSTTKLLVGESGMRLENPDASTVLEFSR
ncbi:MAG: META domain-containing protein [Verrucomicrobiales bacterium]|nr:META domain-containing protein [Verrucomicrobiales bacterium]